MTEPAVDPNPARPAHAEGLPWWARSGKLAWFGMAAGLGCVLATLGSLGFALAQVLAELVGLVDVWALRFLELGLALLLVMPAQLVLPFFLRNRFDRIPDRQALADQALGSPSRAVPMSNETFWVIGISGLIFGSITVMAVWILFDGVVAEKGYRLSLILTMVYLVGTFVMFVFFLLTSGTVQLNPDEEPNHDERLR